MPTVLNFSAILSDDEASQISLLAERLGCAENEVGQRLMDLAFDGLDEEALRSAEERANVVPVDPDLLPRLSETLEVPQAVPEPMLEDVADVELPLLPGMQPGVPRSLYRSIDELPARMAPAKTALRYKASRRYLRAQEEQRSKVEREALLAAGKKVPYRLRAKSDTHHPDGVPKIHPDEKLGERVVWTLWGPHYKTDPDLTVEQWRYALHVIAAADRTLKRG